MKLLSPVTTQHRDATSCATWRAAAGCSATPPSSSSSTDALLRFGGAGQGAAQPHERRAVHRPAGGARLRDRSTSTTRASSPSCCSRSRSTRRQLFAGLYLGLAAAARRGVPRRRRLLPFACHGVDEPRSCASRSPCSAGGGRGAHRSSSSRSPSLVAAARRRPGAAAGDGDRALARRAPCSTTASCSLLACLFADYPIERPMLGLMLANPVDLARVVLLLRFDVSALMGYTGAVFAAVLRRRAAALAVARARWPPGWRCRVLLGAARASGAGLLIVARPLLPDHLTQ